jgi:glycosyltransferase involved in cell wall biosynthesis
VTVIIPAYNAERLVAEAIQSALDQTYPNVEVVVVNDGSTDATSERVRPFLAGQRVRYLEQPNAGPAAARNRGLAEANGEYIAFLDADDLWQPTKLEKQVPLFHNRPELGLVYCLGQGVVLDNPGDWMYDRPRGRGHIPGPWGPLMGKLSYHRGRAFQQIVKEDCIVLSSVVIPARTMRAAGGFNEQFRTAEDRLLFAQIAHDYEIDFVEEILLLQRRHGSNLSFDPSERPQTLAFLRRLSALYHECSLKRPWMRAVYARSARTCGADALYSRRMGQARRELWEACRYAPRRLSNWALLAAALLPRPVLDAVRRLRRRRPPTTQ